MKTPKGDIQFFSYSEKIKEEAICGISEYVRFIESGASDGKQGGRQR